jgi:hypothetical protein
VAAKKYFETFSRKRWANDAQRVAFEEAERNYGEAALVAALGWAALNNIPRLPAIFKCAAKIAKQNAKPKPPTAPNGNGGQARWK